MCVGVEGWHWGGGEGRERGGSKNKNAQTHCAIGVTGVTTKNNVQQSTHNIS
jgi:hypothetical protein